MVFTLPVRTAPTDQRSGTGGCSRRTVLRAGALAAVAVTPLTGCELLDRQSDAPPADPVAPLVASAQDLAARYDTAILAHPPLADRLRPVADAHRAHAAELARVAGITPSPASTAPSTSGPAAAVDERSVLAELRAAEQEGREAARQACLAAPADRAVLLGSIAAARASHLEVLR
jgi:hypothetical protein